MAEKSDPKNHDYEEMGRMNEEDVTGSANDDEFEDIDDAEEDEDEDDLES
jgi:hypothetical protein